MRRQLRRLLQKSMQANRRNPCRTFRLPTALREEEELD
jgi:hypothetical protein